MVKTHFPIVKPVLFDGNAVKLQLSIAKPPTSATGKMQAAIHQAKGDAAVIRERAKATAEGWDDFFRRSDRMKSLNGGIGIHSRHLHILSFQDEVF